MIRILSPTVEEANRKYPGQDWIGRTVQFGWEPIFIAAGAMTGLRTSISIMLGGTLCWAVFLPIIQIRASFRREHELQGSCEMVPLGRRGLHGHFRPVLLRPAVAEHAPRRRQPRQGLLPKDGDVSEEEAGVGAMAAIETPMSWFFAGQLVSLVALALLAHHTFRMPYWQSGLTVPFAFVLSLVACRVTGETDTTPIGAMGQVTQFVLQRISTPPAGNANHHPDEREHHRRGRRLRRPTC